MQQTEDWPVLERIYEDVKTCHHCDKEIEDGGIVSVRDQTFCSATCLCGDYSERG